MGFRTVVVLSNDRAHEWENDPELGKKIWLAAASHNRLDLPYGAIVEQVHADVQSLAVLDGYGGEVVAHTHWYREQPGAERDMALLKDMAARMGYRISKKPKPKTK